MSADSRRRRRAGGHEFGSSRKRGSDGEPRFLMLETVREYGLEQLAASGEEAGVRDAHAALAAISPRGRGSAWITPSLRTLGWTRLEAERDNLRVALGWAGGGRTGPNGRARIGHCDEPFWRARGPSDEGRDWLERALAMSEPGPSRSRAEALEIAGDLAQVAGDVARALARTAEAVVLAREIGRPGAARAGVVGRGRAGPRRRAGTSGGLFRGGPGALRPRAGLSAASRSNVQQSWERGPHARRCTSVPCPSGGGAGARGDAGFRLGHAPTPVDPRRRCARPGDLVRAEALYQGLRLGLEQQRAAQRRRRAGGLRRAGGDARTGGTGGAPFGAAARQHRTRRLAASTPGGHGRTTTRRSPSRGPRSASDAFWAAWNAGPSLRLEEAIAEVARIEVAVAGAGPMLATNRQPPTAYTPRELEVLRLVADGLTDREIAAALFVSRHTAANHVANILAKLGVPSRSAAAAMRCGTGWSERIHYLSFRDTLTRNSASAPCGPRRLDGRWWRAAGTVMPAPVVRPLVLSL